METSIESDEYDVYLVTIGQTLSKRKGVIIQSSNFNREVGLVSQGLISGASSYFVAGQTNGWDTSLQSIDPNYPGSFVYRVDLDRTHSCIQTKDIQTTDFLQEYSTAMITQAFNKLAAV